MPEMKPISRKSAADSGATHELYKPRAANEYFPHNWRDRSWIDWLEQEAARLTSLNRTAVIFYSSGKLGLAVDCKSDDSHLCESNQSAFGMH